MKIHEEIVSSEITLRILWTCTFLKCVTMCHIIGTQRNKSLLRRYRIQKWCFGRKMLMEGWWSAVLAWLGIIFNQCTTWKQWDNSLILNANVRSNPFSHCRTTKVGYKWDYSISWLDEWIRISTSMGDIE